MTEETTDIVLDIEGILVADRYRKEIGDVADLAKSIVEVGLLNPITVREWHGGYRLVAGERRLTAFRSLGLAQIPARVARDIADARDALVAERDENTARKPMLPSEATALGMAIEEMERPAAMERMRSGKSPDPVFPGTQGGKPGHRTRDIAAEAVGMSGPSFTRMKTIVTVAENEDEAEEVREVAREATAEIDNGASIRQQYDKVAAARKAAPSKPNESAPKRDADKIDYLRHLAATYPTLRVAFAQEAHERYASDGSLSQAARNAGVDWQFTEKQWQARVETSRDVLNRSSLGIEVALDAIDLRVDMQTITPEQAVEALERLNASALNRIIKQLKEISNG